MQIDFSGISSTETKNFFPKPVFFYLVDFETRVGLASN